MTNDIRALKAPLPIADPWLWVWIGLGLLALGAAAAALARYWRKRTVTNARAARTVCPADAARRRLEAALRLITDSKAFCSEVSGAVRTYFEDQFKYHAPERTTEEFLHELGSAHFLSTEQRGLMSDFLMRCDLVKFARYDPTEQELRALHASALRLVNTTEPPPVITLETSTTTNA